METFSALLALCAGNSPVPVNSPHKCQWRGALMFTLICARINDWVNNREAGDLRRHRGHYDVNIMCRRNVDISTKFHHSMHRKSSKWQQYRPLSVHHNNAMNLSKHECNQNQNKQIWNKITFSCTPIGNNKMHWRYWKIRSSCKHQINTNKCNITYPKRFLCYWPFCEGNHMPTVESLYKSTVTLTQGSKLRGAEGQNAPKLSPNAPRLLNLGAKFCYPIQPDICFEA